MRPPALLLALGFLRRPNGFNDRGARPPYRRTDGNELAGARIAADLMTAAFPFRHKRLLRLSFIAAHAR